MSDFGQGLGAAAVAVVFFGSNFVVTKKYKSGDGFFFQWVMCAAVLLTGLVWAVVTSLGVNDAFAGILRVQMYIIQCQTNGGVCPQFEPFAMIGGVIWACGNIWVVPIVKCIGLGLGLCIWGSSNMLIGWASGCFGILGVNKQDVSNVKLNYIGVGFAVAAMITFMFIKPSVDSSPNNENGKYTPMDNDDVEDGLLPVGGTPASALYRTSLNGSARRFRTEDDEETSWTDKLPGPTRKIVGTALALLSGLCYGTNFNPPQYVADHNGPNDQFPGAPGPDDLWKYVFPHFCGIFFASTFFMLMYAAASKNAPKLYPEIVLPGFVSGVIWGIAQISFFIANAKLSFVVSFPLIAVGPGLVGALWGTLVFREIVGVRNYIMLVAAFGFAIASGVTIAMSK